MAKHAWRIKNENFRQLRDGRKKLDVRVGYPHVRKTLGGDLIEFENHEGDVFIIDRISVYNNFRQMLAVEGVENVCPGMTFDGARRLLQEIYPPEKERLGVYVFELRDVKQREIIQQSFIRASSLIRDGKRLDFEKMIEEVRGLAITGEVPHGCLAFGNFFFEESLEDEALYEKNIASGEHEIIICYIGKEPVGVAILERDGRKRAIYVKSQYDGFGVMDKLNRKSQSWFDKKKVAI
ncbi:MAG: ASCH domain-containing protein [Candidatus Saccharibacteria bacterium]|nr:ASCH domain-containing protein [Candidatus Saccharibacteria bacterium]